MQTFVRIKPADKALSTWQTCFVSTFLRRLPVRFAAFAASLLLATGAAADAPTLDWRLPLPAGQGWRIIDLREGNGIRHEEYVPRGQGIEDYRDRLLVQRFGAQEMSPEAYLGHIAAGLARHCPEFTTSGLVTGARDGLGHSTRTAYCSRFGDRPYGYVVAQKAIRDGDFLFVVEREWRLPPFSIEPDGTVSFGVADEAVKRDIRSTVRWLTEQVHPIAPPPAPAPAPARPRIRR